MCLLPEQEKLGRRVPSCCQSDFGDGAMNIRDQDATYLWMRWHVFGVSLCVSYSNAYKFGWKFIKVTSQAHENSATF
jgi:hypothetical protein